MKYMMFSIIPMLFGLAPALAVAQSGHAASRNASLDAGQIRQVVVTSGAGVVKIDGKAGRKNVVVRGVARGPSASVVEDIKLIAERDGDRIIIRALMPEGRWQFWNHGTPSLDLEIEVPAGMAIELTDGSGDIVVSGVGPVLVEDGSGGIVLRGISGSVGIRDGSGEIDVSGVDGDVIVSDGSGGMNVSTITGALRVAEDGSGSIVARSIGGGVHVERDGSGEVAVQRVGGDFVVDRKGSGDVRHTEVQGRVQIPERRRRRNR